MLGSSLRIIAGSSATLSSSSCWVPSAWMLIGTFCRFSARFCAVTMIVAIVARRPAAARGGRRRGRVLGEGGAARRRAWSRSSRPRLPVRVRGCHVRPPLSVFAARGSRSLWPRRVKRFWRPKRDGVARTVARFATLPARHSSASSTGPERLLERVEPRLVGAPLVEPVAVDRAADLLGAGGAHRALGSRGSEAGGLEGAGRDSRAGARISPSGSSISRSWITRWTRPGSTASKCAISST